MCCPMYFGLFYFFKVVKELAAKKRNTILLSKLSDGCTGFADGELMPSDSDDYISFKSIELVSFCFNFF